MAIQRRVKRVRKPRVHITYEVERGGTSVKQELPFVVGVVGDFSGDPTGPLKPLAERKFVQITWDNFDEILARMKPGLNLKVKNVLSGGGEMAVRLKFDSMEDFEPASIVKQVRPLAKLLEARKKLSDLHGEVKRSDGFEAALEAALGGAGTADTAAGEPSMPGTKGTGSEKTRRSPGAPQRPEV